QPPTLAEFVAIGERLREVVERVEEQHRNVRTHFAKHVRQHHALGLEARGDTRFLTVAERSLDYPSRVDHHQLPTPNFQRPTTPNCQLPTPAPVLIGSWALGVVGSWELEVGSLCKHLLERLPDQLRGFFIRGRSPRDVRETFGKTERSRVVRFRRRITQRGGGHAR